MSGLELSLAHAERIQSLMKCLAAGLDERCLSEYSFTNLWLFRREHQYRFTDGYWPFISGYTYDGVHHAMPLYRLHDAPALVVDDLCAGHDCLYPLAPSHVQGLNAEKFHWTTHRDDADYLYLAEPFRHYRGKDLGKKRNLMKQLLRAHHVRTQAYDSNWREQAQAVLTGWMHAKGHAPGSADERPCMDALALAGTLNLEGFGYLVNDEPAGFLLAEALQADVYVVRFAKSLDRFKGLAQYMFHHFCMKRSDVRWLNFEQDLGLPNFRQTKQSYLPWALLQKYRVTRANVHG